MRMDLAGQRTTYKPSFAGDVWVAIRLSYYSSKDLNPLEHKPPKSCKRRFLDSQVRWKQSSGRDEIRRPLTKQRL